MATEDEGYHRKVLSRVLEKLPDISLDLYPPQVGAILHAIVREVADNGDPYHDVKGKYNRIGMELYPQLKKLVVGSEDPLRVAVELAVLGNIIDFGVVNSNFDLEGALGELQNITFAVDDYQQFKTALNDVRTVLYLGDNAGEIVFDRILIEEILTQWDLNMTFVVKQNPIINDATMEDARFVGITDLVRVIPNGAKLPAPATVLDECSDEVNRLFRSSDLIISKGQGNFEVLEEQAGNIFFLLKAKCPVIADYLGVKEGDLLIKSLKKGQEGMVCTG